MTTIKELLEARARAMAAHDEDNYGPIYVVGAANAIIADILNARDDLLTFAPAAGAEIAPEAPAEAPAPDPAPVPAPEPDPAPTPAPDPAPAADPAPVDPTPAPTPAPATKGKA